jgi:hypothetical protein
MGSEGDKELGGCLLFVPGLITLIVGVVKGAPIAIIIGVILIALGISVLSKVKRRKIPWWK